MTDLTSPVVDARSRADAAAARLIRRGLEQWPIIISLGVVLAVVAYGLASSRTDQYESTTTVQLSEVDLASVFTGQSLQQQGQDAQAKAATNAELVRLPNVRERTSRALDGRLTPDELAEAVTVAPSEGTTLVVIRVVDPDPKLAARIADTTRESFIAIRKESGVAQFDDARKQVLAQLAQLSAVQKRGPAGSILRDRIQQIDSLAAVSRGGVETVQTARISTAPFAPKPARSAALGLLIGLLLGATIALVRARLDDRVRDTGELTELWDLPTVGLIPETDGLRRSGVNIPDGPAVEALSLARTNLRYLKVGGSVRTLILTSALEGEGKSTITWNLGVAAGLAKSRVLVVEADLRRPMITSRLGISSERGLSEILAGMATAEEAIVPVSVTDAGRGVDVVVDVLPAGLAPPSPIALLEGPAMAELLVKLREQYDIVLIDTPPATIVADAMAFMEHVDGVIIVSRLGRLRRSALLRLRALLEGIDATVLGQIVNSGASGKAYGYTAYTRPPGPEPQPVPEPQAAKKPFARA